MKKNNGLCHKLDKLLSSHENYVFSGSQPSHIQGDLEVEYKSALSEFKDKLKSMELSLKLKAQITNPFIEGIINVVERDTYFLVQINPNRASFVLSQLGFSTSDLSIKKHIHNDIIKVDKYLL